jgi:hypothetical protein
MFDAALPVDEKAQVAVERKNRVRSAVIDMLRTAQ